MKTFTTIAFLFFTGISSSTACSCVPSGSVEEAYKITETIIQGKVIDKEFVSFEQSMDQEKLIRLKGRLKEDHQRLERLKSEFIIKVTLELSQIFKGEAVCGNITLYTTRSGASCGYTSFEVGSEYLIYASSNSIAYWIFTSDAKEKESLERENTLWTNQCTRTTEYNEREANELARLSN